MAYVASGSERVKNYAWVGDSTPWPCTFTQDVLCMALSALGCCVLSVLCESKVAGNLCLFRYSTPTVCSSKCMESVHQLLPGSEPTRDHIASIPQSPTYTEKYIRRILNQKSVETQILPIGIILCQFVCSMTSSSCMS